MALKAQDIVVLVKLIQYGDHRPTYAQIGKNLFLSASEVHAAVRRAKEARLLHGPELGEMPNRSAIQEFLIHGVKYAFPPKRGELTRGVPTAYAAEPLRSRIVVGNSLPPVWPYVEGVPGYAFAPLYKTVPKAALRDKDLYEMLALIDAVRDGRTRERQIAEDEINSRLLLPEYAEHEH